MRIYGLHGDMQLNTGESRHAENRFKEERCYAQTTEDNNDGTHQGSVPSISLTHATFK